MAAQQAHASTRALRSEFLQPGHKEGLPDFLRIIEEYATTRIENCPQPPPHRKTAVRFAHELFAHGELLPSGVFIAALQMANSEKLNGVNMDFSQACLLARDDFVLAWKPLLPKLRMLIAKEAQEIPEHLIRTFISTWFTWEGIWLNDKEDHAVEALQPLAKTILSLSPFLESRKKERLHPYPRVLAQRQISYRALIGFIQSLSALSTQCLSSLSREPAPDPRLFLLMDYLLQKSGQAAADGTFCVEGMSETPDIYFVDDGNNIKLSAYAFRFEGQKGVVARSTELLSAFEDVKTTLLAVQAGDLMKLNPALDQHPTLTETMLHFEKTFKKCKRLFLEPDNLI
ncbi:unnamed protein product [Amoebophrya sp. A25]|nr:unnamed protein product [Amoebophrya sp. A25]|eukprot:GSA25T00025446001.1